MARSKLKNSMNVLLSLTASSVSIGEFGVVYRAYLSRWEDVVSPMIVAVKTLKGM